MGPDPAIPLPLGYRDEDTYINDLLAFARDSDLFQWLCGGVHILDFFAREPYLYEWLLDAQWREWFAHFELDELIDFILREDLAQFEDGRTVVSERWQGRPRPPRTLVEYLGKVRGLSLQRGMVQRRGSNADGEARMPRSLAIGMEVKKVHEVEQFAKYAQDLSETVASFTDKPITHFVDFGSGQNYLGRTMASQPLNKHVIAVESRHENIEGARKMDISANLAPKSGIIRNKKDFEREVDERAEKEGRPRKEVLKEIVKEDKARQRAAARRAKAEAVERKGQNGCGHCQEFEEAKTVTKAKLDRPEDGTGSIQYVEHRLEDGNLQKVIDEIVVEEGRANGPESSEIGAGSEVADVGTSVSNDEQQNTSLMVMSIHSCGNLTHHGLRSIILNPSVTAVAMVGCCYNLLTERLPPPAHKLPNLRPRDKSARTSGQDVHGFPMSERFCNYSMKEGTGVHFNVTARMMAVQAPTNWTTEYSDAFFTRHFFRALLQRIFLDRGVAEAPLPIGPADEQGDRDQRGGQPIIIGSMRKAAYTSFTAYVRAAVTKLSNASNHHPSLATTDLPALIAERMADITDEEIQAYETAYQPRKKELSTVWTLMAFSAQLVEACVVVDRWSWLREQDEVGPGRCWVENVFDYARSPRNLVVVGVKKTGVVDGEETG